MFNLKPANTAMDKLCHKVVAHLNPGPIQKLAFDSAKAAVEKGLETSVKETVKESMPELSDDVVMEAIKAFTGKADIDVIIQLAKGSNYGFIHACTKYISIGKVFF